MSLIYVTGVAGAGKSTVRIELQRRGLEAYGTDEDSLAAFYNNTTGASVGSEVPPEIRTEAWRHEHTWKVPPEKIEKLAEQAKNMPIFLCGVVSNESEFWGMFSHIFALTIDEPTLIQRLRDRPNNNFGKLDHELRDVLEWQQGAAEGYRRSGAILIDATRPIDTVVDDILERSGLTR